jgi:hypothetical protein
MRRKSDIGLPLAWDNRRLLNNVLERRGKCKRPAGFRKHRRSAATVSSDESIWPLGPWSAVAPGNAGRGPS